MSPWLVQTESDNPAHDIQTMRPLDLLSHTCLTAVPIQMQLRHQVPLLLLQFTIYLLLLRSIPVVRLSSLWQNVLGNNGREGRFILLVSSELSVHHGGGGEGRGEQLKSQKQENWEKIACLGFLHVPHVLQLCSKPVMMPAFSVLLLPSLERPSELHLGLCSATS